MIMAQTPAISNWAATASRMLGALRRAILKKPPTWLARTVGAVRELAPYVAIELLLPGGSLVALTLWIYRRQRVRNSALPTNPSFGPAAAAPLTTCGCGIDL
jgi:hypothetical protein